MTFSELARARRSVRKFRPDPVPQELLAGLVETAAWAPSAGNRQDWFFTVVTNRGLIADLAAASRRRWEDIVAANRTFGGIEELRAYTANFAFFGEAPAVIAVSARGPDALQTEFLGPLAAAVSGSSLAAAMAVQNLLLAATEAGLGTCCLTGPLAAMGELRTLLSLPAPRQLVCLVAVGYAAPGAATPVAPARKPLNKIARFLA